MKKVKSSIKPSGHRLLVKPREVQEKTEGGIYIPEQAREREEAASEIGLVLKTGPDCWYDKPSKWAKEGDVIMYAKYAGKVVFDPETNDRLLIINDEDVIGTTKGGKK